jgi:hypothetical protein
MMIGIAVVVFLSGCGKQYSTEISFATYHFTLNSPRGMYSNGFLTGSVSRLPWMLAMYTPQIASFSGFKPSLIIARLPVISGTTVNAFAQKNLASEKNKVAAKTTPSLSSMTYVCAKGKRDASLLSVSLNGDRTTQEYYLSQYFFVDQWYGYVVSFLTDDSSENKSFTKSLKSFTCLP